MTTVGQSTRTDRTRATDTTPSPSSGYAQAPSWQNATKQNPIQRGHEGESVVHLQTELNRHGAGLAVDGKLGPETEAAVRRFQAQNGCKVDGLVGPETRAALERGASTESATESAARRNAGATVGQTGGTQAPTEQQRSQQPTGSRRAGELQREHPGVVTHGPSGSITPDGAGGGTARGDLGRIELPNGATVTGPQGKVTVGDNGGYVNADATLLRAENKHNGASIDVGKVSVESGRGTQRVEGTVLQGSTGDNHAADVGFKVLDAGAEATFRATRDEGRIGAGYRANYAEVNGSVGEVSNKSTDDYRESARVSVGAPSGGAFVSWNDRDGDGAKNYRLDVDVPIPGTPLGVGVSFESESPVKDGLAVVASFNPVTAPIAGAYRLGRALKLW